MPPEQPVRFGSFEYDPAAGELTLHGRRVPLQDQPAKLLTLLVRRPGALVTRDEARLAIWAEATFVDFEASLNVAMTKLRRALRDSSAAPRFIETIPKRGYRFLAEVHPVAAADGVAPARCEVAAPIAPPAAIAPLPTPRRWWLAAAVVGGVIVAGGAAARWMWTPSPTRVTAQPTLGAATPVRITSDSGLTTDPALSQDGTLLAYASDRAGRGDLDIWIQPVPDGAPRQLTFEGADDVAPSLSPDGRLVAFQTAGRDGGVSLVRADGSDKGKPRLLTGQGIRPMFSPDGRRIVYYFGVGLGFEGIEKIFVVDVAGGTPRQLAEDFAVAHSPIWVIDADHVLFAGMRATSAKASTDWWILDTRTGRTVQTGAVEALLAESSRKGVAGGLPPPVPVSWDRDTNTVLFSWTQGTSSNIWRLRISPQTLQTEGAPERLSLGAANEVRPAVGAGRVAFASMSVNHDVWALPLDANAARVTGSLTRLTTNPGDDVVNGLAERVHRLAYTSARGPRTALWLMNLESGATEEALPDRSEPVAIGLPSPDGSRLALRVATGCERRVEVVDTATKAVLATCSNCSVPVDWFADGRMLLVQVGQVGAPPDCPLVGPQNLATWDLQSESPVDRVRHPSWNLFQAKVSPDGKFVAFHATTSERERRVFVASLAAPPGPAPETWVAVSDPEATAVFPEWSPSGAYLYYFARRDGFRCLYAQPLDAVSRRPAGSVVPIAHFHHTRQALAGFGSPSYAVGRDRAFLTIMERTGNIWMLDRK